MLTPVSDSLISDLRIAGAVHADAARNLQKADQRERETWDQFEALLNQLDEKLTELQKTEDASTE